MQEEILLKNYRTGTTVTYFDTHITPENYAVSTQPAALYINSMNVPYLMVASSTIPSNSAMTYSNGLEIWHISGNDNIQRLKEVVPGGRVITGRTFSVDLENKKVPIEKIKNIFYSEMFNLFSGQSENFVFSTPKIFDDIQISFKLERTHDVLNTISTYNKVYNEFPIRNAQTGIVFGKLEAVQKIQDENGNNIRIPLRGVPIGIFSPGEKYDAVTSVDDSGNRIRLNFKESVVGGVSWPDDSYYQNQASWMLDTENYLPDKDAFLLNQNSSIISMPEEFKYTVLTNENGEFVIHDAPVGPQVLMFEVNLLQQGLSAEEVALNFFPYRGENISNIDEVPHYFFRQIPIDVVPCWGNFQTGYTETNIKVNLDLRKWSTYYFPPACNKIPNSSNRFFDIDITSSLQPWKDEGDIDNVVLDRGGYVNNSGTWQSSNFSDVIFKIGDPYLYRYMPSPLVVEVRDMTKKGFPKENIQMVVIEDILKRQGGSLNAYSWINEFSQIRDRAEFRNFGYNAIKLPANLYDPESHKTDSEGNVKSGMYQKGVWICAYQFKMYHSSPSLSYRTTGFRITDWNNNVSRDHFHLNVGYPGTTVPSNMTENISAQIEEGAQVPNYPYEKPWTINYPKKYSIPKVPTDYINPYNIPYNGNDYTVMEYPLYKDGHIVRIGDGNIPTRNGSVATGGFGHSKFQNLTNQYIEDGWYSTTFCFSITNSKLYHYEYGPWTEYGRYANHYIQGNNKFKYPDPTNGPNTVTFTPSSVKNGEEFQRVEAGHGYYLHASGMPRVGIKKSWGTYGNGMDYQCEYDTYRSANAEIYSNAGFLSNDSDFYYSTWQNNYSVVFDGGQATALRLDYDETKNNNRNQGAFSIYRVINPGSILDPTQVYDLVQTVFIKKKKMTLDLLRVIIQNEKTANEPSRFRQEFNNPNDFYPWEDFSRPGKGVPEKAKITIKNNGETDVTVKLGSFSVLIASNSYRTISASELNRTWHNMKIEIESNSQVEFVNNEWTYRFFKYEISFDGITIPDNQWDGSAHVFAKNLPYVKVINSDYADGITIYASTRIKSIKARKTCGNDNLIQFKKYDITTNGLYFCHGSGTYVSEITFRFAPLTTSNQTACNSSDNSSCYCTAYDGFYYGII